MLIAGLVQSVLERFRNHELNKDREKTIAKSCIARRKSDSHDTPILDECRTTDGISGERVGDRYEDQRDESEDRCDRQELLIAFVHHRIITESLLIPVD